MDELYSLNSIISPLLSLPSYPMAPPSPSCLPFLLALTFCLLSSSAPALSSVSSIKAADAGQKLWCVAKPSVPDDVLMGNLNFACGEGGADCSMLGAGKPCYNPDTVIAHASYAMNLYYQAHGRNWWNCYFQNSGLVVFTDPSYNGCTYPAQ